MSLTKLKSFFILVAIVVLAAAIRIYNIDQSPKGALIDEAHFGYLAQSIIDTGKDEHGISYPIIFKGFGDNKLPAGVYLLTPFVYFLGVSNIVIRIPSIIAGSLLTIVMFWLLRQLKFSDKHALFGSLVVAISPWSFFLSRFGFESNLGLFFFTLGLALLLKAKSYLDSNQVKPMLIWLMFSSLSLAGSWYSYISYRPVSIAVLLVFWLVAAWQYRKKAMLPAVVSLLGLALFVLPLNIGSAASANSTRFNQVGILSNPATALLVNENRTFCSMQLPALWCYTVWNKATIIVPELAARYAHSFAPQFLATQGEAENVFLTIQGFGQFYSVVYPLLVIGLIWLLFSQLDVFSKAAKKVVSFDLTSWSLVIAGLIFAPIPNILVGVPQPVRISPLLPFLVIVIVIGLKVVDIILTKKILTWLFFTGLSLVLAFQTASFLTNYYTVHTIKNEFFYQSYLPGLYAYLDTVDAKTQVHIKPFFSDPLMFYAYYTHMDPQEYQEKAILGDLEASGFQHTVGLGNIKTTSDSITYLGCQGLKNQESVIYVTNEDLPYPILYKGESASGVHSFVYAYDATSTLLPENCEN